MLNYVYICTYTTDSVKAIFFVLLLNLDRKGMFSCLEAIDGNVACGVRNPKRLTLLHTFTYSLRKKKKRYTNESREASQSSLMSLCV